MALYFGSTQIPNVYFNPGSGGQTYTLTVVGSANINTNTLCYNKWTNSSTASGDKSITKCVIITGTAATNTGTTTRTFSDVDTVAVSFGANNWYGFYWNNVYGAYATFVMFRLEADSTIRIAGAASCFVEGTLITLADGSKKPIEKLTYENELLVWDFDEGKQSTAKIVQLQRNQRTRHYNKLVLEDGIELYTVYNHSWFNITKNRFTRTMEATDIGDEIMTAFGPKKLISKEELVDDNHVWFYNLITEKVNCYANDILTSNHFSNLYPISNMKYVKEERELNQYEVFAPYCSEETFNALRVAEYDYSNYDQEAIEAEFRWLSLWQYHVIPHDVDVYGYHNDYRESRGLPRKDFNE